MSKLSRRNEPVEERESEREEERLKSLHPLGERPTLVSVLRGAKKRILRDEYTERGRGKTREEKKRDTDRVGKKKWQDPVVYRCIRIGTRLRATSCMMLAVGGGGGGDVGGSGRIDRVWGATNPRTFSLSLSLFVSSIRRSSLQLSF